MCTSRYLSESARASRTSPRWNSAAARLHRLILLLASWVCSASSPTYLRDQTAGPQNFSSQEGRCVCSRSQEVLRIQLALPGARRIGVARSDCMSGADASQKLHPLYPSWVGMLVGYSAHQNCKRAHGNHCEALDAVSWPIIRILTCTDWPHAVAHAGWNVRS